MLMTIEKVIILKSVNIFSDIPDDALAQLSYRVKEIEAKAGDAIIKAGELGTSMYIVVNGKLRVHNEEEEIATLNEREVFGELAALDPEPRAASITALEDTLLFEIDGDPLYELMSEHMEISHAIIHVLCERIRSRFA